MPRLLNEYEALNQLVLLFQNFSGSGGGGSGSQSVTPVFVNVGASASGTIPVGAKGWTFGLTSGTGTFGGNPVSAGFSDLDQNTLLAAINYTTAAGSSAYVRYNT